MNTLQFTHTSEFTLPASPDRVFRALVDPAELTSWFAEHAYVEPRFGGVYRFWGRYTLGTPPQDAARQTITRFEQNEALAFQWPVHDVQTDVTMTLESRERGTNLSVTHVVHGDLGMQRQRELVDEFWRIATSNLSAHLAGKPVILPDYFAPNEESTRR